MFEVTKLRIWKQLTTSVRVSLFVVSLFEVTKLRIWKQLTTPIFVLSYGGYCCLRSQSYEFESNSQLYKNFTNTGSVVWGHKVTNLKATHNNIDIKIINFLVVWGHKVTNLKATHNMSSSVSWHTIVVWGHKVTNLKATHNTPTSFKYSKYVVWGHKVTNLKATHNNYIEVLR